MLKSFSYWMVLDFRIQPDNWQGKHPASGLFLAARGAILCPSLPSPLGCVCRLTSSVMKIYLYLGLAAIEPLALS